MIEEVHEILVMAMLTKLYLLVLIIVVDLMLIITKIIHLLLGKRLTYGIYLVHQRKISVLTLIKQRQNFAWVYVATIIIVIYLLIEKKCFSLKPIIKMLTFQLSFV